MFFPCVRGLCLVALGWLGGCRPQEPFSSLSPREAEYFQEMVQNLPKDFKIESYVLYLKKGSPQKAVAYVNRFLEEKVQAYPYLHVLLSVAFDEAYKQSGDKKQKELSLVALSTAYNLNPNKWFIAYLLGCAYSKDKNYHQASCFFSKALLLRPDQPLALHGLAYTAYYRNRLDMALASIEKALAIAPYDPSILRSASMIYGASGNIAKAKEALLRYESLGPKQDSRLPFIKRRLEGWDKLYSQHQSVSRVIRKTLASSDEEVIGTAQFGGQSIQPSNWLSVDDKKKSPAPDNQGEKASPDDPDAISSCMIDCYLLSVNHKNSTNRGQNILGTFISGLQLSMPSPLSFLNSQSQSFKNGVLESITNNVTKTFQFSISSAALSYNAMIANSSTNRFKMLANPTLHVTKGSPATFISGDRVTGPVSSYSGGNSFNVDVGYKVEINLIDVVKPEPKKDPLVSMDIKITGSFLTEKPTLNSSVADQTFNVSRAIVSTRVEVPMGKTVMLGGLYERFDLKESSRFPILGDIPIVQYLFGQSVTSSSTRSLLFFAVPRALEDINKASQKAWFCSSSQALEKTLEKQGVLHIRTLPAIYYIVRNIRRGDLSPEAREDDLTSSYWGETQLDAEKKVKELVAFLYF